MRQLPPDRKNWDIQAIGQVAGKVNLHSVTLLECHASAMPASEFDAEDYDTHHRAVPFGPEGAIDAEVEGELDLGDGLEVVVMFDYHAKSEDNHSDEDDDTTDDDALQVFAAFTLEYDYVERGSSPTSQAERRAVQAFATFNATLNAWPYWREFLQSTTARMGLPPVTVKTLLVPDLTRRAKPDDDRHSDESDA